MPHDDRGGVGAWCARSWRPLLGEVLATALLMVLGVGSTTPAPAPLTHPALAFGFVVTALVQAFGPVSGAHMNPAVTAAALVHGQLSAPTAAAYVLAQIVGAYAGFGLLVSLAPMEDECAGVTLPAPGVSPLSALLVEALLTGTLALVAGAIWTAHDPARPDFSVPTKFGLTVAGLVYAGGKLTGASLNPARSLAPAHIRGCWSAHWAYWLGPLAGAALCSLLQRAVLLPRPPAPAPPALPEELPLHDKPDR